MHNSKRERTELTPKMRREDGQPVLWLITDTPVEYEAATKHMEQIVQQINKSKGQEAVWLLSHPSLYTAGTSAVDADLRDPNRLPIFMTGRGGEYTYHGPGQRIAYVMFDLGARQQDVRLFVASLEQWIINTLACFNIRGERREDRVGVWVGRPDKPNLPDGSPREDKIAAIGIRIRKWITFHGISLNVDPDLEHYDGIVPCGVEGHGVTSLADLGIPASMTEVDTVLRQEFVKLFGPTI